MFVKVGVLGCNIRECVQSSLWKGSVVMKLNLEIYSTTRDLPNGPVYIWETDDEYPDVDYYEDEIPTSLGQRIAFVIIVTLVAAMMIWMTTLTS